MIRTVNSTRITRLTVLASAAAALAANCGSFMSDERLKQEIRPL
jgi:hypothetical protein